MSLENIPHLTTQAQTKYSPEEWAVRVDLAAAYRLVHDYGWTDMIYNHISARVPGTEWHFLLNAYGLAYDEITASSLVTVDLAGNVVHAPDPAYSINMAGYVIHRAVHEARHSASCVIHTHPCRHGRGCFKVWPFAALPDRLVANLGDCDVMILRNHGLLTVGNTIAEAFNNMYRLERACQVQLLAMACNTELNIPSEQPVKNANVQLSVNNAAGFAGRARPPFGIMEWPSLLRRLDKKDPSFRQ